MTDSSACVCGNPSTLGTVHRADNPCYLPPADPFPTSHPHFPHDLTLCSAALLGEMHRAHSWNGGGDYCPGHGAIVASIAVANPLRTVLGTSEPTETSDMLALIFERQERFQVLLGHSAADMTTGERVQYLKDQILALTDEAHEALNEIGWKPWATSRHINDHEFAGELADILCFLVNLALGVGLTPTNFFDLHAEKALRNIKRQEEKYDGKTGKCPVCKRALDDLTAKGIRIPAPTNGIQMCSDACIIDYRFQTQESK